MNYICSLFYRNKFKENLRLLENLTSDLTFADTNCNMQARLNLGSIEYRKARVNLSNVLHCAREAKRDVRERNLVDNVVNQTIYAHSEDFPTILQVLTDHKGKIPTVLVGV